MDFVKIGRSAKAIEVEELQKLVNEFEFLSKCPDREMVNPFTQERIVVSGSDKALYSKAGRAAGNLVVEGGVILATGVPMPICNEIALRLGAKASADDRS